MFDDSSYNTFGQSPNFREYFGGNTNGTRIFDFPSAAPRFCDKFQETHFESTQEILSRSYYKFQDNDFVFTFAKGKKIKNQCLVVYKMQEITSLHLKKLLGTLTSSIQAILSARLQFQYIQ